MVLPGLPVVVAPVLLQAAAVGEYSRHEKQCVNRGEEHLQCCLHDLRFRLSSSRVEGRQASKYSMG